VTINSTLKTQDSELNLVLTGFMGTGKTTAGQIVATRLGRPFIDMDAVIERRAGMTVAQLFETQGEIAFRQMERALCSELSRERGLVIATGGGALVDPANQEMMQQNGVVICLTATPEALLARLRGNGDRPLLHAPDPEARLRELLSARAGAYAALPHHLDTSRLSPEQTAEAIIDLWRKSST
jgi:shikimate kinase